VKIPFYSANRRSFTCTLILWFILLVLVFTGLGVFRLYFDFHWMGTENESGQLFSVKIRGGQSFNLFDSEPFGRVFWLSQLVLLVMTTIMPMFRLIGGSIIAVLSAIAIAFLHYKYPDLVSTIPLEFLLLSC